MANIQGLYRRNKDGVWRYRPSSKGLPPGSPRPAMISLGTKDESEAMTELVRLRGLEMVAGRPDARMLREWVSIYLDERRRVGRHQKETSKQMEASLKAMSDFFGNCYPDRVDRPRVMAWYASLQEGRTHGTVHRYMRYARAFFYWLVERKAVSDNPAAKLRLPVVVQSKRDKFCTRAERDLIVSTVEGEIKFVVMCGFYLGMRIKEIVSTRWRWFEDGHIMIFSDDEFRTKTGKARMVPYHPVFRAYLAGLERGKGDQWVLRPDQQPGKGRLRWDPRVPFEKLMRDCGVPWVTPHTMRHTFGSLHAMAGTPELKIRRWMGITQATLDKHYAGLSPDDLHVSAI